MAVKDFHREERVAARIITVDPAQRRVEGALKDGGMVQIRVWEIPSLFRWPASGEIWLIKRKGAYWELESRIENNEDSAGQIENVAEGVTQIHGSQVKMGDGRDVVVTDERLAQQGDAPIWDATDKIWIPGPVGGSGSGSRLAGVAMTNGAIYRPSTSVLNAGTFAFPTELHNDGYSINQAWSSSGATGTKIDVPADGFYRAHFHAGIEFFRPTSPVDTPAAGTIRSFDVRVVIVGMTEGPVEFAQRILMLMQYDGFTWDRIGQEDDVIHLVTPPVPLTIAGQGAPPFGGGFYVYLDHYSNIDRFEVAVGGDGNGYVFGRGAQFWVEQVH